MTTHSHAKHTQKQRTKARSSEVWSYGARGGHHSSIQALRIARRAASRSYISFSMIFDEGFFEARFECIGLFENIMLFPAFLKTPDIDGESKSSVSLWSLFGIITETRLPLSLDDVEAEYCDWSGGYHDVSRVIILW